MTATTVPQHRRHGCLFARARSPPQMHRAHHARGHPSDHPRPRRRRPCRAPAASFAEHRTPPTARPACSGSLPLPASRDQPIMYRLRPTSPGRSADGQRRPAPRPVTMDWDPRRVSVVLAAGGLSRQRAQGLTPSKDSTPPAPAGKVSTARTPPLAQRRRVLTSGVRMLCAVSLRRQRRHHRPRPALVDAIH